MNLKKEVKQLLEKVNNLESTINYLKDNKVDFKIEKCPHCKQNTNMIELKVKEPLFIYPDYSYYYICLKCGNKFQYTSNTYLVNCNQVKEC